MATTSPDILAAIARGAPFDGDAVAVVVAHPDDESIGCGGLLQRMAGATLVVATDGAAPADAAAYGFAAPADYAAARARELRAALRDVRLGTLIELGLADQSAAHRLVDLSLRLDEILRLRKIAAVITHAYEGGHPDHDAIAFATHWAGRRAGADILEMPFYRQGQNGPRFQSFSSDDGVVTVRVAKAEMIAAHASQRDVLAQFSFETERFRRAPVYDFRRLPGALYYGGRPWGLTPEEWQRNAAAALDALPP